MCCSYNVCARVSCCAFLVLSFLVVGLPVFEVLLLTFEVVRIDVVEVCFLIELLCLFWFRMVSSTFVAFG